MLFALVLICGVHLPCTFGCQVDNGPEYTTYEPGTMNLIIAAPHGGPRKPRYQSTGRRWPKRTVLGCEDSAGRCVWRHVSKSCEMKDKCGNAGVKNDLHTFEIARDIAMRIKEITGDRPHVVYNQLHRSYLDPNREIDEATFNISDAKRAYKDYHGFIEKAIKAIGGHGLILDIHGQAHKPCLGERIELGYLIRRTLLNSKKYTYRMSSVRGLAETKCQGFWWSAVGDHCFKKLISGHTSLGYYMNIAGLPAVPSPFIEKPGSKRDGYFPGGYTVQTYGSKRGGKVDAFQIEFPQMLRSKLAGKTKCSKELRNKVVFAILCFLKKKYNYSPRPNPEEAFNEFTEKCRDNFETDEM